MDNELNMEIAKTNRTIGVPKSITRLFGDNNLFVQSIESHKHVRSLTFQLLGPQGLKLRVIEDIDLLARKHMEEGARNGFLDVKEAASKVKKKKMSIISQCPYLLANIYIPLDKEYRLSQKSSYYQSLQILIECLAKKVMGDMDPETAKELAICWRKFPSGWFRFPFKIPGMGVYDMMKVIIFKNRTSLLYMH